MESEQQETDLVKVVNRAALIENVMNQIIHAYVAPREHAWLFVWSVMLDTSVMSLGSKVKVVLAIAQEVTFKLNKDAVHRVVNLRNAFAHSSTDAHPVMMVGKTQEECTHHNELWILGGSGKIDKVKRHAAFGEFNKFYGLAKDSLVELLDRVKQQLVEHQSYASEKAKKQKSA
jgi:hypothetical protein